MYAALRSQRLNIFKAVEYVKTFISLLPLFLHLHPLRNTLFGRVKDTKVASALLCAVIAQNERARSRVKVSSSKLRHIDDGAPDAFSGVLTQKEIDSLLLLLPIS